MILFTSQLHEINIRDCLCHEIWPSQQRMSARDGETISAPWERELESSLHATHSDDISFDSSIVGFSSSKPYHTNAHEIH